MTIEIVFNIFLALGIVFYLFHALQLPSTDNPADVLGANGFPIIIGILALIVLAMISIKAAKDKHKIHIPMFEWHTVDGRMLIINVFLLAAYVGLLDVLGYAVSTLLYLIACPMSIGYRKWGRLTVFSVATTTVLVASFGILFYVPLPRGVEFFRELSYLIY